MQRTSHILTLLVLMLSIGVGSIGCKAKPTEKSCKEAIENVRRITTQSASDVGIDPSAAIRSCRANSSKKMVECMRTAKTEADLATCEGPSEEVVDETPKKDTSEP